MVRLLSSAAALTVVAGLANAGMSQAWLSFDIVDNGGISDGSPANLAGSTTYDLFWNNFGSEAIGVNGFNLGTAAQPGLAPFRMFYTGTVFNHAFGSDTAPNAALIPAFPALAFDTFFDVGGQSVSFVPGSASTTGGEILGTWFTQPPVNVAAGERLRFMRLTVFGELDIVNSSMEVGFSNNTTGVFTFVPTPGAAALLGLGGLVAGRRRR
jgi:uncharacterized protein (TIGR03382 family)